MCGLERQHLGGRCASKTTPLAKAMTLFLVVGGFQSLLLPACPIKQRALSPGELLGLDLQVGVLRLLMRVVVLSYKAITRLQILFLDY